MGSFPPYTTPPQAVPRPPQPGGGVPPQGMMPPQNIYGGARPPTPSPYTTPPQGVPPSPFYTPQPQPAPMPPQQVGAAPPAATTAAPSLGSNDFYAAMAQRVGTGSPLTPMPPPVVPPQGQGQGNPQQFQSWADYYKSTPRQYGAAPWNGGHAGTLTVQQMVDDYRRKKDQFQDQQTGQGGGGPMPPTRMMMPPTQAGPPSGIQNATGGGPSGIATRLPPQGVPPGVAGAVPPQYPMPPTRY